MVGGFLAINAITTPSLADDQGFGCPAGTNSPSVRIITPQEGQSILSGDNIFILAASRGFTDAVSSVEFFEGTNSLGTTSNNPVCWSDDSFTVLRQTFSSFVWTNAATGEYTLTAVATDLAGTSVTSAPVDISVVTDLPPVIRIVKPKDGKSILGPTNLLLVASATDPDGSVASVEFFEGTNSLGVVTNPPPLVVGNEDCAFPVWHTVYSLTWSNVAIGDYSLTAVATDNAGVTSTSAVVNIAIVSNLPPFVRIFHPRNGAQFVAPATVNIRALTFDASGTLTGVEFFEGTNSLGSVTNGTSLTNDEGKVWTWFNLAWKVVAAGDYCLTAVASDDLGGSSTSAPVHITVHLPPPPAVKIIMPYNGARFFAPAKVHIAAVTRHFTNSIASIQFLAGTNTVGTVSNPLNPVFFNWTNVSAGQYTLTALATDTGGIMATSPPVNITVCSNQPQPVVSWWNFFQDRQ
jgi:hypothetical protein